MIKPPDDGANEEQDSGYYASLCQTTVSVTQKNSTSSVTDNFIPPLIKDQGNSSAETHNINNNNDLSVAPNNKPFVTADNKVPSVTENNKPFYVTENNKPPYVTENNKPPYVTENNKPPSLTENNKSPYVTEINKPPSVTENNKPPSVTENNKPPYETEKNPLSVTQNKSSSIVTYESVNNNASVRIKPYQLSAIAENSRRSSITNDNNFFGATEINEVTSYGLQHDKDRAALPGVISLIPPHPNTSHSVQHSVSVSTKSTHTTHEVNYLASRSSSHNRLITSAKQSGPENVVELSKSTSGSSNSSLDRLNTSQCLLHNQEHAIKNYRKTSGCAKNSSQESRCGKCGEIRPGTYEIRNLDNEQNLRSSYASTGYVSHNTASHHCKIHNRPLPRSLSTEPDQPRHSCSVSVTPTSTQHSVVVDVTQESSQLTRQRTFEFTDNKPTKSDANGEVDVLIRKSSFSRRQQSSPCKLSQPSTPKHLPGCSRASKTPTNNEKNAPSYSSLCQNIDINHLNTRGGIPQSSNANYGGTKIPSNDVYLQPVDRISHNTCAVHSKSTPVTSHQVTNNFPSLSLALNSTTAQSKRPGNSPISPLSEANSFNDCNGQATYRTRNDGRLPINHETKKLRSRHTDRRNDGSFSHSHQSRADTLNNRNNNKIPNSTATSEQTSVHHRTCRGRTLGKDIDSKDYWTRIRSLSRESKHRDE